MLDKMNGHFSWKLLHLPLLIVGSFFCMTYLSHQLLADDQPARKNSTAAKTRSSAIEKDASEASKIDKKLAKILTNQEAILQGQQAITQKIDSIMEELRIIKVRSTH